MSSYHAVFPNDRVVQDRRPYPDERVIMNRAAVQHGLVANCYTGTQRQGHAFVRMQDRTILNVSSFADCDRLRIVSPNDCPEPDGGLLLHDHVAYLQMRAMSR